jgi:hypothetical protein
MSQWYPYRPASLRVWDALLLADEPLTTKQMAYRAKVSLSTALRAVTFKKDLPEGYHLIRDASGIPTLYRLEQNEPEEA